MPKISVIIPVYNTEKYISDCLNSVLSQTFTDFEVICINDGSIDNSAKILEEYRNRDNRIKVITQKNKGVIVARNNAIQQACGEFIYPLDSDDIIDNTMLEKLYQAYVDNKGDIITSEAIMFGKANLKLDQRKPNKFNMSLDNCLVNSALFKKSLFEISGGYDEQFKNGLEDWDFWLNMIFNLKCRIYKVPEYLFFYRIKSEKESRNAKHIPYRKQLLALMYKKYPKMLLYRFLHKVLNFLFSIKYKQNKTFVKIFKLTVFKIKYKQLKTIYCLFGFIPILVKKTIQCYFFEAVPNFGDLLNKNLFNFFGKRIASNNIKNSNIVAIGSLLQTLFNKKRKGNMNIKKPLIVYGSGFIEDIPMTLYPVRRLDVRAVRGYKTLEKLKSFKNKNIKISKDVVIGDPGLLSKYFIDVSNVKKKYDLGIIPHYVDKNNPLLNKIKVKNSIIIDIQQNPEVFLYKIAECKNIISSAMHGLIAADSLNIPNVRMILSDKIIGGDYKFDDYYSAFGLQNHKIINLSKTTFTDKDMLNVSNDYRIEYSKVIEICNNLIKNFPY